MFFCNNSGEFNTEGYWQMDEKLNNEMYYIYRKSIQQ